MNQEMSEGIVAGAAQADAVLLGRRTYVEFAKFWPNQSSEVPMADFLNNSPKYVVAATLASSRVVARHGRVEEWRYGPGQDTIWPGRIMP